MTALLQSTHDESTNWPTVSVEFDGICLNDANQPRARAGIKLILTSMTAAPSTCASRIGIGTSAVSVGMGLTSGYAECLGCDDKHTTCW